VAAELDASDSESPTSFSWTGGQSLLTIEELLLEPEFSLLTMVPEKTKGQLNVYHLTHNN
jgi:hypothetical protein